MSFDIQIIGGGLAGSEAAWQLAEAGVRVRLSEMRGGGGTTPAHETDRLAEMVCSNSFRSDDAEHNAVGLLHQEMRALHSLVIRSADKHRVPAGSALAVDREGFATEITRTIEEHPNIQVVRERVDALPHHPAIVATGPLTGSALAEAIAAETGEGALAFFDAIAPIVHRESIDMDIAWMAARWDKGGKDYINCPLDKAQYEDFGGALVDGEKMPFHDWEKDTPYFEGCMPIEVMAERGRETLRHGPMKPFGLTNPHAPQLKAYAIVQLRQDNRLGTLFNMVGFQTKLKHGEQVRIFRTIPGLENAEFARLGGIHRNSFINSPRLLDRELRLKSRPNIRFAGQITGCEGYVESAAVGLIAACFAAAELRGEILPSPPPETALGALLGHITGGADAEIFQPMNVNFGLMPPLSGRSKKADRKKAYTDRARAAFADWLERERVAEPA
jgi:methylenetetrahydrofolate--tRNA-(uracil-5-)-methyltransferase